MRQDWLHLVANKCVAMEDQDVMEDIMMTQISSGNSFKQVCCNVERKLGGKCVVEREDRRLSRRAKGFLKWRVSYRQRRGRSVYFVWKPYSSDLSAESCMPPPSIEDKTSFLIEKSENCSAHQITAFSEVLTKFLGETQPSGAIQFGYFEKAIIPVLGGRAYMGPKVTPPGSQFILASFMYNKRK